MDVPVNSEGRLAQDSLVAAQPMAFTLGSRWPGSRAPFDLHQDEPGEQDGEGAGMPVISLFVLLQFIGRSGKIQI